MNKKISKIVLLATVSLMLIITIALGLNMKDYELKDISGSRENLDNVNIILKEDMGRYRTKEVRMSKNGTKINEFAKASDSSLPFTKEYMKQRDFYSNSSYGVMYNYEDEDTIGFLEPIEYYHDANISGMTFRVKEKNLQTNKINQYDIKINDKKISDNYSRIGMPIKYEGYIYVLIIDNDESTELLNDDNFSIYVNKESNIKIYKLDLENKSAELVDSKNFKMKDKYIDLGLQFKYNNKYYIVKDILEIKSDKSIETTRSYITYDLETKKFETIETNESIDSMKSYSITNLNGNIAQIIDFINGNNELKLNISKLDLTNNKLIKENEVYTIDIPEDGYDYNIEKVRSVNNKLCIVVNGNKIPRLDGYVERQSKNYIYVIDEKTKDILYEGFIGDTSYSSIGIDIVLDEEL